VRSQFRNRTKNEYFYDASGVKHTAKYNYSTSTSLIPLGGTTQENTLASTFQTDYCGNYVYEKSGATGEKLLKRILTPEGYVETTGRISSIGNWTYTYPLKDHLGNTRVKLTSYYLSSNTNKTYSASGQIDYYPFGMEQSNGGTFGSGGPLPIYNSESIQYMFNGKEIDRLNGLNEYDFGARWDDPAVGRWGTMDPLCEKYYSISPYAYCEGNPVNRTDPDGREWKDEKDKKIAAQIQKEAASRDKSLVKQEVKINAKINNIKNNTKLSDDKRSQQIATQQNKLESVKTERNLISALDKGITQLGDSKTKYTFNTVEFGTTATLSSKEDGTVVINNYGTLGNRSHETTHAIDYDNNLMFFNPLGSNNLRISDRLSSEIRAYGTEYSITGGIVPPSDNGNPNSIFEITPSYRICSINE